MKCNHVFISKGKFYERRQWILGGHLFMVFSCRQCTLCNKLERKMVLKKKIATSPDTYEKQLQFSGIKPIS